MEFSLDGVYFTDEAVSCILITLTKTNKTKIKQKAKNPPNRQNQKTPNQFVIMT